MSKAAANQVRRSGQPGSQVFGPVQAAVDKLQQLAYCFAAVTPLLPRLEEHGAPNPIASASASASANVKQEPKQEHVSAPAPTLVCAPTPMPMPMPMPMPACASAVSTSIDPATTPAESSATPCMEPDHGEPARCATLPEHPLSCASLGRASKSLQVAEPADSCQAAGQIEQAAFAPVSAGLTASIAPKPSTSPASPPRVPERTSDAVTRQLAAAAPAIARRTGYNRRFGLTPVSEVLPNYRPLRYVLDYDAFAEIPIDSYLTAKLVALSDSIMSAACDSVLPVPGASVRAAAPATIISEAANDGVIVGGDSGSSDGVLSAQALATIPIDPDIFVNGCLAVDFSLGYPAIGNAIFWERWDNEPADAYRWFKCYLAMPENCGLRNFAQFLNILTTGSLIPVNGRHYYGSRSAQANVDAISSALQRRAIAVGDVGDKGKGELQSAGSVVDAQEIARIKAYYHLFYWEDRCMCFNIWEATMLKERQARRSQFILDDHFTLFQEVFDKVAAHVSDSVDTMDPKDAIKALQDIAKMMRLSVGMPADKPAGYNDGPQIINNNNNSANNSFPPQLRINFVSPNMTSAGALPAEITRVGTDDAADAADAVGDVGNGVQKEAKDKTNDPVAGV